MSQQELLRRVVFVLDRAGIDYMITGSMASSLQGEPRSTHDIDIVVAVSLKDVSVFLSAFPVPDFYLDEAAIEAAIRSGGMFNLLDVGEGEQVEFWVLTADQFDRSRFSRKYVEDFAGAGMKVSRPEDTILMKLRWAQLSGGSEKQFGDALRVYEVQHDCLDMAYLNRWAGMLGVESLWARLQKEAVMP